MIKLTKVIEKFQGISGQNLTSLPTLIVLVEAETRKVKVSDNEKKGEGSC